jgi:hydrogenase/urease accessory protein HupE
VSHRTPVLYPEAAELVEQIAEWLGCAVRLVLALAVVLVAGPLAAHPLAPALLEIRELGNGIADVTWKVPRDRPPGAAAVPRLPERCRALTPEVTGVDGAGMATRWRVDCGAASLAGERLGVAHPEMLPSGAVVRVVFSDGRVAEGVLAGDPPVFEVPAVPRPWRVLVDYARLGVDHILTGPDHLLFVFGLVLLAGASRRLLTTVTAFTLGHSVTLAAAVLGLVRLPAAPIEIAIAASVFVLAVELARDPGRSSAIRRRPWVMAFVFGLLHGLGFASALTEAGLPADEIPLALLGFNLGIEVGQIAFVGCVLAIGRSLRPLAHRMPLWSRWVPVYAMGSLAALWWIERTATLFR